MFENKIWDCEIERKVSWEEKIGISFERSHILILLSQSVCFWTLFLWIVSRYFTIWNYLFLTNLYIDRFFLFMKPNSDSNINFLKNI